MKLLLELLSRSEILKLQQDLISWSYDSKLYSEVPQSWRFESALPKDCKIFLHLWYLNKDGMLSNRQHPEELVCFTPDKIVIYKKIEGAAYGDVNLRWRLTDTHDNVSDFRKYF